MKNRSKRKYPPYYGATLGAVSIIYFWTVGTYFYDAPLSWIHNRSVAYAVSFVLFIAGMTLCFTVFDQLYPKLQSKRALKNQKQAPLLVRIMAFVIDLLVSFALFTYLVTLAVGQVTSNGFSLAGWKAGLPFLLVFLYFFIMDKFLGGTLAKRVFGIN